MWAGTKLDLPPHTRHTVLMHCWSHRARALLVKPCSCIVGHTVLVTLCSCTVGHAVLVRCWSHCARALLLVHNTCPVATESQEQYAKRRGLTTTVLFHSLSELRNSMLNAEVSPPQCLFMVFQRGACKLDPLLQNLSVKVSGRLLMQRSQHHSVFSWSYRRVLARLFVPSHACYTIHNARDPSHACDTIHNARDPSYACDTIHNARDPSHACNTMLVIHRLIAKG